VAFVHTTTCDTWLAGLLVAILELFTRSPFLVFWDCGFVLFLNRALLSLLEGFLGMDGIPHPATVLYDAAAGMVHLMCVLLLDMSL
jgi:hypothetical protein